MKRCTRCSSTALLAALCMTVPMSGHAQAQPSTLTIDAGAARAKSSPTLYGLMTEEINYSYDGGLYGELLRNRTFRSSWSGVEHWTLSQQGDARASMTPDQATGPSAALPTSVKLSVASVSPGAGNAAGIANEGYWGIAVRPHTTYQASFYAKAAKPGSTVTVALVSDDTGKAVAEQTVPGVGSDWQKYSTTLQTGELVTSERYHFVLSVAEPGTYWFGLASLFPPTYKGRVGGNRIDLMEKLAAMHPTFLRMPGGNYLEGDHIAERFDWKKTIGPMVDRPTHQGPWSYRSSDGMGLLEFLEWCEDLGIQPVLAVYGGYSLQQEHVEPGAALAPYVQDALDEIEYVTGAATTRWGAERAKDGHPKPFTVHYVEVGNEDNFDKSGSYDKRYAQFYDAIKAQYPLLSIIATTAVKGHAMDVVDDHYYKTAQEFFDDVHHYDKTDRDGTKIFVGEWATREGLPTPNFGAALGDAAWMTGMERNSDVIVLSSYAPLFTNINPGGLQWDTDLIGYDAMRSYGSPSYYAQVLFAQHHGDEILQSAFADGAEPLRVFQSVTRDSRSGTLYLKLVNANTTAQSVHLDLHGAKQVGTTGHMYMLSAPSTAATNTITEPTRIVPAEHDVQGLGASFELVLSPLSINVLEVPSSR
ncbi:alpha-L-arabinofuranosidase C-terminal domain-containing protein [Acidipila sp. EB88]|uniref:alpha-L-arabinofuranosidase C-terminal domain-containing protein n=1 Tax=Acidipila sp. EB88 TaxID=2305226 RepID=UPI000F5E7EA7|nr:alpha-L-arabinofuranosidase C-terminal domain-containing protein [Acidipila sp. EB88]RRA48602.1 alpha-N-arabinofuranosidase [Acidipila sp. EB88]